MDPACSMKAAFLDFLDEEEEAAAVRLDFFCSFKTHPLHTIHRQRRKVSSLASLPRPTLRFRAREGKEEGKQSWKLTGSSSISSSLPSSSPSSSSPSSSSSSFFSVAFFFLLEEAGFLSSFLAAALTFSFASLVEVGFALEEEA